MYSFSLQEYTGVFKQNLDSIGGNDSANKENTQELITSLINGLFKATFTRFGYCMFKKDKLAFALHISKEIEKACLDEEYNFLLGRVKIEENNNVSLPSWADQSSVEMFGSYCQMFPDIVKGLRLENDAWKRWYDDKEPESNFPSKMMLRGFQKALLISVFRPDRLQRALELFVCREIGLNNLNEAISSVSNIFHVESSNEIPTLFITSLGSDPSKELEDFANKQVGHERFQ